MVMRIGLSRFLAQRLMPLEKAADSFLKAELMKCEFVINVSANLELRKKRSLKKRDGLRLDQINSKSARQLSEQERLERADYTIFNKQNSELLKQVIEVHEKLKTVAVNDS